MSENRASGTDAVVVAATPGAQSATPADTAALAGDRARATVSVAVPPERAFTLFTQRIDLWWRRGPRFRNAPGDRGFVCIEPRVGGRVFESFSVDGRDNIVEMGRVLLWAPPTQLVFEWRAVNFAPGEVTEVEVSFVASSSGTRVTVEHRGWRHIRPDHPARHGLDVAAFIRMMGLWWGDQMTSLRELAAGQE